MRILGGGLLCLCVPLCAHAGSWPAGKGHGQVIVSFENLTATSGFDQGDVPIRPAWRDQTAQIYGQYGLSDDVSLSANARLSQSKIDGIRFQSSGPIRINLHKKLKNTTLNAPVSLTLGLEGAQKERGVIDPSVANEASLILGVSRGGKYQFAQKSGYFDLGLDYFARSSGASQWRIQAATGLKITAKSEISLKAYAGFEQKRKNDPARPSHWQSLEAGISHDLGASHSLSLSYRQTVAGQGVAKFGGPVVSLTRKF